MGIDWKRADNNRVLIKEGYYCSNLSSNNLQQPLI